MAAECGPVLADPVLLNHALLNLCTNARDAMPGGGTLTLAAGAVEVAPGDRSAGPDSRPGSFVRLSVADTGCGMTPEVRARIFEPFFTTKETGKGSGLGLAMGLGIVSQHGGWIDCSTAPGSGTRIDLYLPAATTLASGSRLIYLGNPSDPADTPPPADDPDDKTVLLVDDEAMIRTLGRVVLEGASFRVLTADDGAEAIEVFARNRDRIDLVVLDLSMPRMSGRDAFRQIARLAPNVRVLFSTGYSIDDVADLDGAIGLLSKPYRPHELLAAVRDALDADPVGAGEP